MENQLNVKEWVLTLLLLAIPIVNIIFLILWSFKGNNLRRNYARATLIVTSIIIGIALIIGMAVTIIDLSKENEIIVQVPSQSEQKSSAHALLEANENKNNMLDRDIEILEVEIQDSENIEGSIEVVGKLRNNSLSESYSKIMVKGNAYDEDGAILHTFDTRIDDTIPPGEIYNFRDWTINNDTKSVEIIEVYSRFPY